jgi:cell division protein FtsL
VSEIEAIQQRSKKTFILTCANFAMLAVLFLGLGFVIFQAATLVGGLKQDLAQAEQQLVELKERVQQELDAEMIVQKAVAAGLEAIQEELAASMPSGEALEKLGAAADKMENTAEAVEAISEQLQGLDADEIGKAVSYHILKGLGQGLDEAAESRKPAGID